MNNDRFAAVVNPRYPHEELDTLRIVERRGVEAVFEYLLFTYSNPNEEGNAELTSFGVKLLALWVEDRIKRGGFKYPHPLST